MIADYHMHLERGGLDAAYLRRFVETAAARGVDEICITEHAYHFPAAAALLDKPDYVAARSRGYPLDAYVNLVLSARAQGLPVRLGIEMDYIPGSEEDIARFLEGHPWDLVIGAVHWIGDWGFDLDPGSWAGRDVTEAYRSYFALAEQAVRSGLFDVFAHPDVIKVFGARPDPGFGEELLGWYDRLVAAARQAGVCLELSSAGLRKPVGEIYPDRRLLERAHRAGVPITLASDAHEPQHVGWAFDRLVSAARDAGYRTVTTFSRRRPRQAALAGVSSSAADPGRRAGRRRPG
ncbi:MAG TPA: histidinol-phosphatase [Bacillota bacterium]